MNLLSWDLCGETIGVVSRKLLRPGNEDKRLALLLVI